MLIFVLYPFFTVAQSDFDGVYYHKGYNEIIKISGNKFEYIVPQTDWTRIFVNDTLAVCKFAQQFIELNSYSYYDDMRDNTRIILSEDTSVDRDSVVFHFTIPKRYYYRITINTFDVDYSYVLSYESDTIIPKNFKKMSFDIYVSVLPQELPLKFSLMIYSSPIYSVPTNVNNIQVNIPEYYYYKYFESYYIKGDYVNIRNDTIRWRGQDFIKLTTE